MSSLLTSSPHPRIPQRHSAIEDELLAREVILTISYKVSHALKLTALAGLQSLLPPLPPSLR